MFDVALGLHLCGAAATALASMQAALVYYRKKESRYRAAAAALLLAVTFQTVTGALLYFASEHMTLFTLCKNVVLYLTVPITLELFLAMRLRKTRSAPSPAVRSEPIRQI